MPIEMGLWRVEGDTPRRIPPTMLPLEKDLEDFLCHDPSILGEPMLIIGRQVPTKQGKFIDLLGMDADGDIHVLELKRDKTPRDVVAQVLDYAQWVSTQNRDDILIIADTHLSGKLSERFDEAFGTSLPEEINQNQRMLIVATQLDDSSERIVAYLRGFGLPINAVFFAYLQDGDHGYLARSWLVDEASDSARKSKSSTKAGWNQIDWYVSFGEEGRSRDWGDAREYGFVSAGGGAFYSRTLRRLPQGARISVHIPQRGYVGVGRVVGDPVRFDQAQITVSGVTQPLREVAQKARYRHVDDPTAAEDDDQAEWMVPVEWLETRSGEDAFWRKGMFANQNSACPLRDEFTLQQLGEHFASGLASW